MTCSASLIEAYFDEELDASQRAAVEQHLATCQECSALHQRLTGQRQAIRAAASYYHAPAELRQSIRPAIRPPQGEAREMPWRWLAVAASLLLVASLSWNLLQLRRRAPESDLADAAVADHVRSLLNDHLTDVASSDQHTVKPWFAGKLDFSPEVKDLAAEGFPLVGGRVDYLAHRRVAALVYRRRQHIIDLFIWPTSSAGAEGPSSRDGYNVVHWTSGSMTYWAVSDVSLPELEHFRDLLQ
jgi:anti-sigma factor RsiW